MKLFSSDRVFCFGCSVNTSKPEIISADDSFIRRRTSQRKSAKHWKPVLKAIDEDGAHRRSPESTAVARSDQKNMLSKPKSARRTRSESYHDDYRKSSHDIPLPVFSPTPFLF